MTQWAFSVDTYPVAADADQNVHPESFYMMSDMFKFSEKYLFKMKRKENMPEN